MTPWPSCSGGCGGPAAPTGAPSLSVLVEVRTVSEANSRAHYAIKARRVQVQRAATTDALALALGAGQVLPARGPWYVRLTRLSRGRLDDDNLGRCLKAIRDTVAAALGVDDGSESVAFVVAQDRGAGVRVEVWGSP